MLLNIANQEDHPQSVTSPAKKKDINSLSERINISTRVTHTKLNRLIIARLPLALPPHQLTPSAYISGLLHIAPIYITFESLWQQILDSSEAREHDQIRSTLLKLRLPAILRSGRLREDIKTLSGFSCQEVDEQLLQNAELSKFTTHTTKSVYSKPHVLLAYVWVMYMAIFSGGRYIRASLQDAGEEFWRTSSISPRPALGPKERKQSHVVNRGLQFFHFPGEEDGEDVKTELKTRFAQAEMILSPAEKDDVVQEAQHIFDFMVGMVGELDRVCESVSQKNVQVATIRREGDCIARKAVSWKQNSRAGRRDHFQVPCSWFARVGCLMDIKKNSKDLLSADAVIVLFVMLWVIAFVVFSL